MRKTVRSLSDTCAGYLKGIVPSKKSATDKGNFIR